MAIYDLALPDGRTLTLEAPNEQAAMSAATDWHAANPKADSASVAKPKGYGENFAEMATEGAGQLGRGVGQLHNALDFAISGAGRNVVPDTPANRVAGGFSALDPRGPQAPLTTSEHSAANRQAVGDVVRGFGNTVSGAMGTVYSPLNAAFRTYVGQPVEQATGSKDIGTAAEIAAGLFGPSALTRVAQKVGRMVATKPTAEQIEAAATAGFQSPVIRSLEIQPSAVQTWAAGLQHNLSSGLGRPVAGKTWGYLDDVSNIPAGARVTGHDLQALRQNLATVAKERGPDFQATPDAAAATRAIEHLDRFIARGITPRDVISGNPAAAAATWAEARGNYAQFAKIRAADRRQIQAEGNSQSAHSGLNFDNTMRQKMRDVATGPAGRGFTGPGEREAVERVVFGSPERNALRVASSALGGGGGIAAPIIAGIGAAGTASMGGWGAAAPFAGMGMRVTQNAMTSRDMDRLNAVLRANAPLATGPTQNIARSLMGADTPQWLQNAMVLRLF